MVRVHEELDGEGFKGEDARIKHDAESNDVPVRAAEAEDIAEDNLVGGTGLPERVLLLVASLENPVEHCANHTQGAKAHGDKQRVAPAGICRLGPGGRIL